VIEMDVEECLKAIDGELISGISEKVFRGVSIDSRTLKKDELFICIRGDRFDGHDFIEEAKNKKAAAVVLSDSGNEALKREEIPVIVRVDDTLEALQELARFHRRKMSVRVVGITGTNGKSTTKEMTAAITEKKFKTVKTKGNLNNHIGLPLSIFHISKNDEVAIVEMGMSASGEIKRLAEIAQPQIAVLTNITEGHMVELRTLKDVQAAKGELYESLDDQGIAIVNADDPLVLELAKYVRGKVVTYGINNKADVKVEGIRSMGKQGFNLNVHFYKEKIPVFLPFLGECNIYNALAAMATGCSLGMAPKDIQDGLRYAKLLPSRYEIVEYEGMIIINDSYNANPRSMQEALKTLTGYQCEGRRFFVVGDMLELGDLAESAHMKLGVDVARSSIDYLVSVGSLSTGVVESAVASGMNKKYTATALDHKCAVSFLKKYARPGDCLLVKGSRGSRMEKVVGDFIAS